MVRQAIGLWLVLPLCFLGFHCGFDAEITGEDGAEMVLISEGEFTMGGKKEEVADHPERNSFHFLAERPSHRVRISAFYLDKYEITNARYRRFLDHVESTRDTSMDHPDQPENQDHIPRPEAREFTGNDHPATGVSWYDAYAYCKWVGRRLPTEAEWEYAARGSEEYRKYPWGNIEPDAGGIWRANYRPEIGWAGDGQRYTAPVGSYPDGISPFGIADMAGNAEEWVQDWVDFSYYKSREGRVVRDPRGPEEGDSKAIKGGSYASRKHFVRIATRLYGAPRAKSPYLGFRCARDL